VGRGRRRPRPLILDTGALLLVDRATGRGSALAEELAAVEELVVSAASGAPAVSRRTLHCQCTIKCRAYAEQEATTSRKAAEEKAKRDCQESGGTEEICDYVAKRAGDAAYTSDYNKFFRECMAECLRDG
jgi:hypothetical protein